MKRYVLYYQLGSIKFYQRLFFASIDEAHKFASENPFATWKIFDFYKGEFVEFSENPTKK